jgi:hypothetical protein
MARVVDPSELEGDELTTWYRRSAGSRGIAFLGASSSVKQTEAR